MILFVIVVCFSAFLTPPALLVMAAHDWIRDAWRQHEIDTCKQKQLEADARRYDVPGGPHR